MKHKRWRLEPIKVEQVESYSKKKEDKEEENTKPVAKRFVFKFLESLDLFAADFDWGIRETHGNVLSLVSDFNIVGRPYKRKFSFPVKSFKCALMSKINICILGRAGFPN